MHKIMLLVLLLTAGSVANAQSLPRRVYLGVKLEDLTDDTRRIMELDTITGVLIKEVLPQSTAGASGFKRGDVILNINGYLPANAAGLIAYLGTQTTGTGFPYQLLRGKKKISGKSVFKPFPEEKYADLDVIYSEVSTVNGLQRLIISKPKGTLKLPVVVFIGGIGCYSLDNAWDTTKSESQLLSLIGRAGFMCVRVEKPGMGDNANHCNKCAEVSFDDEMQGYGVAINAIKNRNDVDSNRVFIIGHSMGGVMAPLLAQQTNIKGIICYGTIGSTFLDYLNKTRRTIGEAYGWKPDETDDYVRDYCECAGYYFVEKMTTAEAAKKKPDCKDYLSIFDYRSRDYNNQMYAVNIPAAWKPFKGNALFLWGESDYISSRDDHQILSDAVNQFHSGHAEFGIIKNASHGMQMASSFAEARTNPGAYNPAVGNAMLTWLLKQ
jgi:pimeloyl-ACP methyl ester carboxylesterase